jgi:glycosyltransferase involved in cell wall biosynthesis
MANKLTVILPVYNGMPYLPEAVGSILNQTLHDFNLLIIDDGSTDETNDYLRTLNDSRVQVVRQENQGSGVARNRGIDICQTEFIALMDADDISLPNRLQLQIEYMEKHPEISALGSQVGFFAGNKKFSGPEKPLSYENIYRMLLRGKLSVCNAAFMFRTSIVRNIGGYRIKRAGEDVDFFLRLCEAGRVENLPDLLYLIRVHRKSLNWVAQDEIILGRAYAIECAKRRRAGLIEPDIEEFKDNRNRRSIIIKILDRIDSLSASWYRHALLDLGESKKLSGILRLALAVICRPYSTARRFTTFLKKYLKTRG